MRDITLVHAERPVRHWTGLRRLARTGPQWLVVALLTIIGLLWLIPFIWMLSISFSESANVAVANPPEWIPSDISLANYRSVLAFTPMMRYFLNTTIVGAGTVILVVVLCSLAAYAFAKGRFPGRRVLFVLALSTMMVPHEVTLIPMFVLMYKYHLLNSYFSLILPAITSGFGVFLITQFIRTVPDELLDAARMDGASEFLIWARIVVPLIKPALATLAVLTFLEQWNSFLYPLVMLSDSTKYTVTIGLMQQIQDFGRVWWGNITAAASMAVLPILVLFIFLQRWVIRGITFTGIKG